MTALPVVLLFSGLWWWSGELNPLLILTVIATLPVAWLLLHLCPRRGVEPLLILCIAALPVVPLFLGYGGGQTLKKTAAQLKLKN